MPVFPNGSVISKYGKKKEQIKEVIRNIAPQVNATDFVYFLLPINNVKTRKSKRQQKSVLRSKN
jgi:hypothetical protein